MGERAALSLRRSRFQSRPDRKGFGFVPFNKAKVEACLAWSLSWYERTTENRQVAGLIPAQATKI